MKIISSLIVVTKHLPKEAVNVPIFFLWKFLPQKKTDGIFLMNAYIQKSTLII